MPALDGTGPSGRGPMTGRGTGCCTGYTQESRPSGRGPGRGFFCGCGRGLGWRNQYYATGQTGWQRAAGGRPGPGTAPTKEEEIEGLKRQSEFFEKSLGDIRKRIAELESKPQDE